MKLKYLGAALLCLTWLGILSVRGQSPHWPFIVTPHGYPNINIRIAEASPTSIVPSLTLQHTLVYDGATYSSRIIIPELECWLIKCGSNKLEWQKFGQGSVILRGTDCEAFGRHWTVQQKQEKEGALTRILSSNADEKIEFIGSYLKLLQQNGETFHFDYVQGRLATILRTEPDWHQVLTISYSDDGQKSELNFEGKVFRLFYNSGGQLTRCIDGDTGAMLAEYDYSEKHLVARIAIPEHSAVLNWGDSKWTTFYDAPEPLTPVISTDGIFNYTVDVNRDETTVHFIQRAGKVEGSWRFDHRSGDIKFHFVKGTLADCL